MVSALTTLISKVPHANADTSTAQPTPTQVIANVDTMTQPQALQLSNDDDVYHFVTPFNDQASTPLFVPADEQEAHEINIICDHYWLFTWDLTSNVIKVIGNATTNVWLKESAELPTIIRHVIFDVLLEQNICHNIRFEMGPVYRFVRSLLMIKCGILLIFTYSSSKEFTIGIRSFPE